MILDLKEERSMEDRMELVREKDCKTASGWGSCVHLGGK